MMCTAPDQVFFLHGSWMAMVNGKLIVTEWPNKGSALAGMQVEQRRQQKRADAEEPTT